MNPCDPQKKLSPPFGEESFEHGYFLCREVEWFLLCLEVSWFFWRQKVAWFVLWWEFAWCFLCHEIAWYFCAERLRDFFLPRGFVIFLCGEVAGFFCAKWLGNERLRDEYSCRGFSGVYQNLVNIKNESLMYISKGIWCSQERFLSYFRIQKNLMFTGDGFSLNSGFTKIWCTPEKPLLLYSCTLVLSVISVFW